MAQLRVQYGQPIAVLRIIPASDFDGTVEVQYEKAVIAARMVLDRDPPYPVIGLQITGVNIAEDSVGKIKEEMRALLGQTGFEVAEISNGTPAYIDGLNQRKQFAIGSVFKLYVLATLSEQIKGGEKKWSDVVALNHQSLPSGVLQNWPAGAPLTLQTLATLMISISDNTATDMLIDHVGRRKIEQLLRRSGHSDPSKALPFLTTLETFALKMPRNDDLRERFAAATESNQHRLLEQEKSRLGIDSVSVTNLATSPRHIDTIEWFASPADISKLLAAMHSVKDQVVTEILAINPIIPPGDAKRWEYVGSKGGSEPGVVSFAFLIEAKSGRSYAISGSWNNPKTPVDETKFLGLMNRLLNITAERR
ncbi:serine hydrolase [Parasphingorhabdus halotolerans]|uniref:Serine hydrolase n=1 Tax=Parasphingorhabdus halotolerans TaxID=2725558 RepID=A0A6H2DK01_9SPHN|nr:serine hydrolase [Parasphingorhabdus halotolerans]QJB67986.1 serine hydrolase [Parasphingorhabdus halotolerans]